MVGKLTTIGIQLARFNSEGEPKDLYSRGCTIELYGIECNYMGPTPDGLAWFWVGPGDVRPLDAEQLQTQGLRLTDIFNGKSKGKQNG